MYHAVVRWRIRRLFDAINRGDAEPVLRMFGGDFEHRFLGAHALSGSRNSLAATRAWYERLYRLLPDIRFQLTRIWVAGGPWNTLVVIEWDESNSGTDGVRTSAHGIHAVRLRWGRAANLIICPDTVRLVATLDRLAAAGNREALAAPITG